LIFLDTSVALEPALGQGLGRGDHPRIVRRQHDVHALLLEEARDGQVQRVQRPTAETPRARVRAPRQADANWLLGMLPHPAAATPSSAAQYA
jgi:hypothetical protein